MNKLPLAITAVLLSLAAAATGCGRAPTADPPQGVVLVLLDTARPDRLSAYGHHRATSPALERLAAEGVRFDQAISYAPWTLPSAAALLAGEYPGRVLDDDNRMTRSLAEALSAGGVATAGVTEGVFVSRYFGMDRGFEHWEEQEGELKLTVAGEPRVGETGDGGVRQTFDRAIAWLEANRDRRFFLLIHTYEPHTPYRDRSFAEGLAADRVGPQFETDLLEPIRQGRLVLTGEEKRYVRALYDGDLLAADRQLGRLLDALERLGLDRRTAVIVTSDHGEDLGGRFAHRIFDHGHSLRDDLVRVPLVVRDPTRPPARRRVTEQVRLIDVLPTVADLLEVEPARPLDGRSLLPLIAGTEAGDRLAVVAGTKRGPVRAGLRDGRYKLIVTIEPGDDRTPWLDPAPAPQQLYDLQADPGETRNLAAERPGLAGEMLEELRRWSAEIASHRVPTDPEIRDEQLLERLRSLGYLD